MKNVNIGIIGAGRFGQLHLKSYNDSDLANIIAISGSGRNPEKTTFQFVSLHIYKQI